MSFVLLGNEDHIPPLIVKIVNESDNNINVTIVITNSKDVILYNETLELSKAEMYETEKITEKKGKYYFDIYVDENRTLNKRITIDTEHSAPTIHIRNNEILMYQEIE